MLRADRSGCWAGRWNWKGRETVRPCVLLNLGSSLPGRRGGDMRHDQKARNLWVQLEGWSGWLLQSVPGRWEAARVSVPQGPAKK